MSEIKFACPHCSQHIACDAGYADLAIDCPSCGQPMVVPRLTGADSAHPRMVIVASTSVPPPPISRPPAIRAWTEQEWAMRVGPGSPLAQGTAPVWMVVALGTLIVSAILRAHSARFGVILAWVIVGSIISGLLLAKGTRTTGARAVLKGFGLVVAVIIVLPVLALSILFIGCAACQ